VAVGDLNGDGKADLAVANFGDGTVSVLQQEAVTVSSAPAVASFDPPAPDPGNLFGGAVGILQQQPASPPASPPAGIGALNGGGQPGLPSTNTGGKLAPVSLNTTPPGASAEQHCAPLPDDYRLCIWR
jgi:hypothetical protein